ncbi:hypothetical protein ROLI_025010 [Roseobacter fucihabitans]|uniref:Flp pilus assembly protein TadG n=1 Tax=Roseobacter fucihabitans TaxID=1537242 RepID=A0ABZ2BW62_9RHOB|nr:hypothetical protein [Roseobacter litoralis]MBC6965195.1 hypothetical protein [Roseobacter litoralis]
MIAALQTLRLWVKRFARGEEGNVTIEFVIICPLMFWTHMAMYTYFDAFKEQTINQKAAFTVADLISRQAVVNAAFIDGSHSVFNTLVRSNTATAIRVTSVSYDAEEDEYSVLWSQQRGADGVLTTETVRDWHAYLPVMYDTATVIVVETWSGFSPVFKIGMAERTLHNFTFTRPRYSPSVGWEA